MHNDNLNSSIKIDRNALKFNQGAIVFLTAIAFLFNISWLVAFVSIVLILGTIFPAAGLFKLIYKHIFKPLGIIKPEIVRESNKPHLFAQGMGGIFLAASFIFLTILNYQFIGWLLAILVLVLAFVNIVFNFCAGCFLYYQLGKTGLFNNRKLTEGKNA